MKQQIFRSYHLIVTILMLLCGGTYAQSFDITGTPKMDSLQRLANTLSGTQKVDALNALAYEWFNYDREKANDKIVEALDLSENLNYTEGNSLALIYKGVYEIIIGQTELSIKHIKEGIELSRKTTNKGILGYGLLQHGAVLFSTGKMDSALLLYNQSYDVLRDSLDPRSLYTLYRNMSKYYSLVPDDGQEKKYLFRSLIIVEELNDPALKVLSYAEAATYFSKNNLNEEALQYVLKAELLTPSIGQSVGGLYELKYVKAKILIKESQLKEALKILEELNEYDKVYSTLQHQMGRILEIGILLLELGDYELSLINLFEALKIAETNNYEYERCQILVKIGFIYFRLNQISEAEDFTEKGLFIATSSGFKSEEATAFNLLGLISVTRNSYDSAFEFYQKSLLLREQLDEPDRVLSTIGNLGVLFENQGMYNEALRYFQRAIEITKSSTNSLEIAWTYKELGLVNIKLLDYENALENLNKAESISKAINAKPILAGVYQNKVELYKALNNNEEALLYFSKYDQLKDSISSNTLTTRIAGLELQHEIREKNQEIVLLDKDKALQQSQISKQRTVIVFVIVGVIILMILSFVLYRNYNTVSNLNKSIKEQNEEIQVQSEELIQSNNYLTALNEEVEKQKDIIEAHAEERYRRIFNNSILGIYQSTPDGRFITINPAMAKMFGYDSPEEMISSITNISTQLYIHPQDRERVTDLARKATERMDYVFESRKKNKEIIWARVNGQIVYDDEGEIDYFEGTIEDITSKIDNEKLLKTKNEELAKINGQMERFLYSASHDLRSPISSILGLVSVVRMDVKDELALSYMSKVEKSAQKLDNVIKNIVDFSRTSYQANQNEIVDFKKLIDKIIRQYSLTEFFQKIDLEVIVEDDIPFYSDKDRLEIALENLFRNSITFFDPTKTSPFIKIIVKTSQESATIEIIDNGIGIRDAHVENIFKMFYRGSERAKGAGLGLFIAKESLLKINATITVESEFASGTTFRILVPNGGVVS